MWPDADKAAVVSWLRANVMGRLKPYGHRGSAPKIDFRFVARVGANRNIYQRVLLGGADPVAINLEFYPFNYQFSSEINFLSLTWG